MGEVRTFIAVTLEPVLQEPVLELMHRLHKIRPDAAKWVSPEALHFTLAFLGQVSEERLPAVLTAAHEAAAGFPPFGMQLGALGMFPPEGPRHILWIGAARGAVELIQLQAKLAASLRRAGFVLEDRPFLPHLTLARAHAGGHLDARLLAVNVEQVQAAAQMVSALKVYRSDLTSSGPHYTCLCSALLGSSRAEQSN